MCLTLTNIFHIYEDVSSTTKTTCTPITNLEFEKRINRYFPLLSFKILLSLGSESSLDPLNALEADKIILVEGEDDSEYI